MIQYQYIIKPLAQRKIRSFYNNVAKKYRHVYDKDDQKRNVYDALQAVYDIEKTLAPHKQKKYIKQNKGQESHRDSLNRFNRS